MLDVSLSHKKRIAWQKAILFLPLVYDCCRKLPLDEKYNPIAQMKSAALSISNNLAEGAARNTKKDFFFAIATGTYTGAAIHLWVFTALPGAADKALRGVLLRM